MNTYYGDFQTKVMNHYVRLLQTDSYLMTKVAGRVYPQHVSLIENPKFPSISFKTTWTNYHIPDFSLLESKWQST